MNPHFLDDSLTHYNAFKPIPNSISTDVNRLISLHLFHGNKFILVQKRPTNSRPLQSQINDFFSSILSSGNSNLERTFPSDTLSHQFIPIDQIHPSKSCSAGAIHNANNINRRLSEYSFVITIVDGYIYQVHFKRSHRNFYLSGTAPTNIAAGDFVKVQATTCISVPRSPVVNKGSENI